MTTLNRRGLHLHPVHPAVYGAEACRDRAREAGRRLRARKEMLEVQANRLFHSGDTNGDLLAAAHARTCNDAALDAFGAATGFDICVDELRKLEDEVVRLQTEINELREWFTDRSLPSHMREALDALMASGAALSWRHDVVPTLEIAAAPDRVPEVFNAITAAGAKPVSQGTSPGESRVMVFSTAWSVL